jgi:hypothetical protein
MQTFHFSVATTTLGATCACYFCFIIFILYCRKEIGDQGEGESPSKKVTEIISMAGVCASADRRWKGEEEDVEVGVLHYVHV